MPIKVWELGACGLEKMFSPTTAGLFIWSIWYKYKFIWFIWQQGCHLGESEVLMGGLNFAAWSSWSQCWVQCLCTQPFELRCGYFAAGTLVWRAGCQASAQHALWASETQLSTKEKRLDFMSRFHVSSLGTVDGLCGWYAPPLSLPCSSSWGCWRHRPSSWGWFLPSVGSSGLGEEWDFCCVWKCLMFPGLGPNCSVSEALLSVFLDSEGRAGAQKRHKPRDTLVAPSPWPQIVSWIRRPGICSPAALSVVRLHLLQWNHMHPCENISTYCLGMKRWSRVTWSPRIIPVWEAVGLQHSWKPRLFWLVTVARVAVLFFMITVLYLFSQPRSLALLWTQSFAFWGHTFGVFLEEKLHVWERFIWAFKGILWPRLSLQRTGLKAPFTWVWCPHGVTPVTLGQMGVWHHQVGSLLLA